jgi:hypothetical protein
VWDEAATSASSKNKFDPIGPKTYESRGIYEAKQKALDQTDAQDCADLFSSARVTQARSDRTVLRHCGTPVDSDSYPRQRSRWRLAAIELRLRELRRSARGKN